MKIEQTGNPVEIGESHSGPQAFQISASREAFRILSSGLYNDKKLAIIRELCCNAYDAHVAAGKKEVPFELHLPTSIEPYFSVKDYGTGLPKGEYPSPAITELITTKDADGEESYVVKIIKSGVEGSGVLGLYCTYFSTDKSRSNDFVGALGLGSKSPFCYNEGKGGFTVVSRFNGKTTVYSAYINEGLPHIICQQEEDTPGVENGLEVSFPVNTKDCWEFENKARIALEFFNPQPILNIKLDINKQKYTIKGENWGLRENVTTHHTEKVRAIQGMVQYSTGTIDESLLTDTQRKLLELPLDLFFPIGQLSVAASRETLSNDSRTIQNIIDSLLGIQKGIVDELKKELAVCTSSWEARIKVYSMINTPGLGGLINEAHNAGQFDGNYGKFSLSKDKPFLNELEYQFTTVHEYSYRYNRRTEATKSRTFHSQDAEARKVAFDLVKNGSRKLAYYNTEMEADDEIIFIIADVPRGESYIHYFLQQAADNRKPNSSQRQYEKVYLISRLTKLNTTAQVLSDAKRMLTKLGNPPMMLLSELKKKYRQFLVQSSITDPTLKRDVLWFDGEANIERFKNGYESTGWRAGWKPLGDDPLPAGRKFYVTLKNLHPISPEWDFAENFGKFISNVGKAKVFGLKDDDMIYGMNELNAVKIKSHPDWIDFTNYVFDMVPKIITPKKEIELSLLIREFATEIDEVLDDIAKDKNFDKLSPMQVFCNALAEAKQADKNQSKALAEVVKVANRYSKFELKLTIDFHANWQDIIDIYPMLEVVKTVDRYTEKNIKQKRKEAILDYIRLVDADRETAQVFEKKAEGLILEQGEPKDVIN